jgi:WD40 repeat protein
VPLGRVLDQVGSVESMAFSPDGRTLAVTDSRDRTVRLLDISNPARPRVEGTVSDGGRNLSTVVISPDGHTIATADPAGEVKLWAVADRRHPRWIATLPHRGTTTALAFSPTAPVLAVTGDGSCELWDTADPARPTSKLRLSASGAPSNHNVLTAVAFGPDGRFLLRAGVDGTVEMVNAANGQRYTRFTEAAPVRAAAFDAIRRSVVTGTDNGTVHLWRALAPATVANQPTGDQQGEFSATGQLMTGMGADGGLSLWEMTDGREPEVVASVPSAARDGFFTPDGTILVTVGSGGATVWSVVDPRHPARLSSIDDPAGRDAGSTTMIPGTSALAMSAPDGSVAFWDLAQPRRPRRTARLRIGPPGAPATFAVSPARHVLAVRLPGSRLTVRLVDVSDPAHPTILGTLTHPTAGARGPSDVAISGDGRVLAITDRADAVRLWDIADLSHPVDGPVLSPAATPGAIAFAPRGGLLAVGSADSAVHLWDVRDARHPVALIALPAGFAAEHLAFSPDGSLLAAGGQNGTTLLWSTTDPHRVAPVGRITFSNATAVLPPVTTISFNPDGDLLSVGLAGRVQFLVDLDTDRLYRQYCALPESRITRAEWNRYLPGVPYRPPC